MNSDPEHIEPNVEVSTELKEVQIGPRLISLGDVFVDAMQVSAIVPQLGDTTLIFVGGIEIEVTMPSHEVAALIIEAVEQ